VRLILGIILALAASPLYGSEVIGVLDGEAISGDNKTCFYLVGELTYGRTVDAEEQCPPSITVESSPQVREPSVATGGDPRLITAEYTHHFAGENNTVCYYDGQGETYTKVVLGNTMCPLSIQVRVDSE
jgi:hypothetical protein